MASLSGIAGGLLSGFGEGMVSQAEARRQEGLERAREFRRQLERSEDRTFQLKRDETERSFQTERDKLQDKQRSSELGEQHKNRLEEIRETGAESRKTNAARPDDTTVNKQLVTRPVGEGLVQDFAWNPRTNQREPSGEPYRPVTPHTGNVTEGERKAAALGTRLESALQALDAIEKSAPGASRPGLAERGLEAVGMEAAANTVRSSDRQQADSAQLDALDAALTLATGAAYTREQLQNLRKSYFPQIGDSDENVAAKQKRFQTIVETARIASGRAEPAIDKALDKGRGASGSWAPGQAAQVGEFTIRRLK